MFPRAPTATRIGLPMPTRRQTPLGFRTSTARNVGCRSVNDVSYYRGKLFAKMTEVKTELNRIQQETAALKYQETIISMNKKKATTLAEELTTKQGLLADLNAVIEKVNMGCNLDRLRQELSELKASNDQIENEHELLYANRIDQQSNISEMKSVISDLKQQGVLTTSDYEAVKSNPRKLEFAKLEIQLWHLENQKSLQRDDPSIHVLWEPEEEMAVLTEKLASLVEKKLKNISKRLLGFPKQEQYEKFLAKNLPDFAHEDTTPAKLLVDLGFYLEQIKVIDRNLDASMRKYRDKSMDLKEVWMNSMNLSELEQTVNRKRSALTNQKTNLECRNHSLKMTLDTRSAELENYHRQLMRSKDYSSICDLELKLSNYCRINYDLKEYLEEGKALQDLQECTERTLRLVDRLNEKLKSSL